MSNDNESTLTLGTSEPSSSITRTSYESDNVLDNIDTSVGSLNRTLESSTDHTDSENNVKRKRPSRIARSTRSATATESSVSTNAKHYENDYDFDEQESTESWLMFPSTLGQNNLTKEKSQHRTQPQITENEEYERLEPFAKECLHLFNGEWTVMDPNRGTTTVELVNTTDYKHLMFHNCKNFEPITKRSTYHPQLFSEK